MSNNESPSKRSPQDVGMEMYQSFESFQGSKNPSQKSEFASTMHGPEITKWVRNRKTVGDSDFERNKREREMLYSLGTIFGGDFLKYMATGDLKKLDSLTEFLEREQNMGNIQYDEINLTQLVKTIRNNFAGMNAATRVAVVAALARNSADELKNFADNKQGSFVSFGLTRGEGGIIQNVSSSEAYAKPTMLKVAQSPTTSKPWRNGTFMDYWKPIREQTRALFSQLGI